MISNIDGISKIYIVFFIFMECNVWLLIYHGMGCHKGFFVKYMVWVAI
jgi:hypothetical protein